MVGEYVSLNLVLLHDTTLMFSPAIQHNYTVLLRVVAVSGQLISASKHHIVVYEHLAKHRYTTTTQMNIKLSKPAVLPTILCTQHSVFLISDKTVQ